MDKTRPQLLIKQDREKQYQTIDHRLWTIDKGAQTTLILLGFREIALHSRQWTKALPELSAKQDLKKQH